MGKNRASGVVVAAVVVALAGGLFSLAGTNTVDRGDIRRGAVGKSEIRKNAVGHAELRLGSVRGEEVDETSLGKVPSALRADTAANADSLAGKSAGALDTRWALVNENGTIERQTGGFTIVNCYLANANCYLSAGDDVTNNGMHAQIVVANASGSPVFSGEVGVAPCGATFVACAPPGTESANVLVVSPRESDGTPFGAGTGAPSPADAARFYVFVTGSEG